MAMKDILNNNVHIHEITKLRQKLPKVYVVYGVSLQTKYS